MMSKHLWELLKNIHIEYILNKNLLEKYRIVKML